MYEETLSRIRRFIESRPEDSAAYGDYFDIVRAMWEADREHAFKHDLWLRNATALKVKETEDANAVLKFFEINKKTYAGRKSHSSRRGDFEKRRDRRDQE